MGGGLIQIASYGLQDIFLIGNPQITFFKTVYRKHTNFSMEYIQEYFDGIQNFGNYLSCNISKAGDLMHRIYLKYFQQFPIAHRAHQVVLQIQFPSK